MTRSAAPAVRDQEAPASVQPVSFSHPTQDEPASLPRPTPADSERQFSDPFATPET